MNEIIPGTLSFAAHVLLGEALRYRLVADRQERRGSDVAAGEMRHDAARLTAVAMRLAQEARTLAGPAPVAQVAAQ